MTDPLERLLDAHLDWRTLSASEVRAHGISYRLSNGKQGEITDPQALRTFYARLSKQRQTPRRIA
jgi:hypothetical protein